MQRQRIYLLHAALMLSAVCVAVFFQSVTPVLIGSFGSIVVLCSQEFYPRGQVLLAPNVITLGRLAMVLGAVAIQPYFDMVALVMLIVALVSDGLDGYVARKLDQTTDLGADLDIESDSIYVVVLSVLWWSIGIVPWWLLVSGVARYAFVILLNVTGLGQTKSPSMKGAREIAVIHFIALLTPFVLNAWLYVPLLGITGAFILLSFTREYYLRFKSR